MRQMVYDIMFDSAAAVVSFGGISYFQKHYVST